MKRLERQRSALGTRHDAEWRDPAGVATQWREAGEVDPRLLRCRARGAWWETLAAERVTLLVTREYEHLMLALKAGSAEPAVSYLRLPHPSGLVADAARGVVHVASTRNPNQVYDLMPASSLGAALNGHRHPLAERPLMPVRCRYYPGCLYLHDLALVGGELHANAVGQNAVVRLGPEGHYTHVWWPRSVETRGRADLRRNYLQLNSIAAGRNLSSSYFSASAEAPSPRRPGHRHFPVDRRGVIFSGATREPVVRGLTRPHSARLRQGRLWVDNSGYGEVGVVEDGRFRAIARLPGWTRGLGFHGRVVFVGTSRILPRFRHYAPGLDPERSVCGVHALDARTGAVLGSLVWPFGNQLFAVEPVPTAFTSGFPFRAGAPRARVRERELFYAFLTALAGEGPQS